MNAQEAKAADGGGSGMATPAEKFGTATSFPSTFPADDGRRYDPEALSYGNNGQPSFAR